MTYTKITHFRRISLKSKVASLLATNFCETSSNSIGLIELSSGKFACKTIAELRYRKSVVCSFLSSTLLFMGSH